MEENIKYKINGKVYTRDRQYSVYSLIDPLTKEMIYIGHTSDSYNRIRFHIKYKGKASAGLKLKLYLATLNIKGLQPIYKQLKTFETNNLAKSMEKALIRKYKPICNIQYINN